MLINHTANRNMSKTSRLFQTTPTPPSSCLLFLHPSRTSSQPSSFSSMWTRNRILKFMSNFSFQPTRESPSITPKSPRDQTPDLMRTVIWTYPDHLLHVILLLYGISPLPISSPKRCVCLCMRVRACACVSVCLCVETFVKILSISATDRRMRTERWFVSHRPRDIKIQQKGWEGRWLSRGSKQQEGLRGDTMSLNQIKNSCACDISKQFPSLTFSIEQWIFLRRSLRTSQWREELYFL